MERDWPVEALDFSAAVRGALARAGGIELARRCEENPSLRTGELMPVLEGLGLFELAMDQGLEIGAAAALAAHAAGEVVCPWPLVQQLAVPTALRPSLDAIYLRDGRVGRVEHIDVLRAPGVLDFVTGELRTLRADGGRETMPLDPFGVAASTVDPIPGAHESVAEASIVLSAFWISGALGTARDLAAEHARERRQFGRPIAEFGGIQWHLSDIAVAHEGLWELACFSLARLLDGRLSRGDALAMQWATQDAGRVVLTAAHQITAAIGLCEEHDLTVIDRHVQATLRRPCGAARTLGLLADEIGRSGFENLYPVPALEPAAAVQS